MTRESIDYAEVMKDLEVKRALMNARFDAAIAAIRHVIALNGAEHQPDLPGIGSSASSAHSTVRVDPPFRGMVMGDAAIKHLQLVGRHVPNPELARALEFGGFEHRSKNFPNTLNSVLRRRAMTVGDLEKTGEGWGLPKWRQRGNQ